MAEQEGKSVTKQAAEAVKRSDPAPRHADGAAWGSQLKGRDPTRKYVLVGMADDEKGNGPAFYEELGYRKEVSREGGVRLAAGKTCKDGEYVTFRGHVLMSIALEDAERIRVEGAPGAGTGQRAWDKIVKSITAKNRNGLLRGIDGSQYMGIINDTSQDVRTNRL